MDCFMDDIDETSMCEGSRQSQQDFNYNATGGMSIKKGQVSGTGYNTKKGGRADSMAIHDLMEMSGTTTNRNAAAYVMRDRGFTPQDRNGAQSPLSGDLYRGYGASGVESQSLSSQMVGGIGGIWNGHIYSGDGGQDNQSQAILDQSYMYDEDNANDMNGFRADDRRPERNSFVTKEQMLHQRTQNSHKHKKSHMGSKVLSGSRLLIDGGSYTQRSMQSGVDGNI